MRKAFASFVLRQADDSTRTISGIASTIRTDRMGDVVVPEGAKFKLPMPLLWQHDSSSPVGTVDAAQVSDTEIAVTASIPMTDTPSPLRDRLVEAWESVKLGLVRGLSIGFQSIEDEPIKGTYGIKFKTWEWLELSLVTIPANADAGVTVARAFEPRLMRNGGYVLPVKSQIESFRNDDGSFRFRKSGGVEPAGMFHNREAVK